MCFTVGGSTTTSTSTATSSSTATTTNTNSSSKHFVSMTTAFVAVLLLGIYLQLF